MTDCITWNGRPISYRTGDTVSAALLRAGIRDLGPGRPERRHALFCGIGQCQGCLVRIDGRLTEACLLPCRPGLAVTPAKGGAHD